METPTLLNPRIPFTRQVWVSQICSIPQERVQKIVNIALPFIQRISKENSPRGILTVAINCQNMEEIERAMKRGTMIIHLRKECKALQFQAQFLQKYFKYVEAIGLTSCSFSLILFFAIRKHINVNPNWSIVSSISDILKKILYRTPSKQKDGFYLLTFLIFVFGVFTSTSASLIHYGVSRATKWDQIVDYKYVKVESCGHSFLIKQDMLKDNQVKLIPFSSFKPSFVHLPLYSFSGVMLYALAATFALSKRQISDITIE